MYDKLKNLYIQGKLTENGLNEAVRKGWITEEEKEMITRENG